jgi:DMSO/TMAO reductase YedYZ molybdopterin-dependent catalytic subunit
MSDVLCIAGLVEGAPLEWTYADCRAAPAGFQVDDVGALVAGYAGRAVRFAALLAERELALDARWVQLEADDGAWAASLPLEEVLHDALVLYEEGGAPLAAARGGPFRLLIPGYRDMCANVKHLGCVTFADAPGRDTRPRHDARACRHEPPA